MEIGQAVVPLNKILASPLKQTPSAVVRVYEDHIDVKNPQTGQLKASLRVIIYLEDNGVSKAQQRPASSLQQARDLRNNSGMGGSQQLEGGQVDYQTVW